MFQIHTPKIENSMPDAQSIASVSQEILIFSAFITKLLVHNM